MKTEGLKDKMVQSKVSQMMVSPSGSRLHDGRI